jgi:hypothetical protein
MIRYFVERSFDSNACDWPELERYAGEFFDEDFQIMDSAALTREYGGCLEYTQMYTKIAKGRHFYRVNTDSRLKVKYMISMFSQLDKIPLDEDSRWTRPSNFEKRLYDIIFWLEDMEKVEIDIPNGSLSHGWQDLDFVDTQAVGDNLKISINRLMLLDACDRYFCLIAFIWKMICQTGNAELFTIAYKKGFIPKSQIDFSLEKYGNGEFKWDKSLVPVMLAIAKA